MKTDGWAQIPMGKTCNITTGKKDVNEGDPEGDYPFFTCSRTNTFSNSYSFDTDAILVAGNGEVGNLHRYKGKFEAYQRTYVLDAFTHKIDYIFQYITAFLKPELLRGHVGSTIPFIKLKDLTEFQLRLPTSKPEQSKIAEVLSTVDRAIEQTQGLIAKQQRIKTGLMQDLLTRGIDEHGNLRSEETHQFKDSPLGRIPVEWNAKTFEEVTPNSAPIGYGIVQPGAYDYTGVKVAGIYTINSNFQRWHMSSKRIEQAYVRSRIKSGDVLLSIKGTTGRAGVVPYGITGNISREIARIRPVEGLNPQYLRHLILSDFFQWYLGNAEVGTTRAELSIKILRELFVVLPPPPEQDEIVSAISSIEQSLKGGQSQLAKLRSLKTALMQDLLTGKVRVNSLLDKVEAGA